MNMTMIMNMPNNELINFPGLSVPENINIENELKDFYKYLINILNASLKTQPNISREISNLVSEQEIKGKPNDQQAGDQNTLTHYKINMEMQPVFFDVKLVRDIPLDEFKVIFNEYPNDKGAEFKRLFNNQLSFENQDIEGMPYVTTVIEQPYDLYNSINLSRGNSTSIFGTSFDKKDIQKIKLIEKEIVKVGFNSKSGDAELVKSLSDPKIGSLDINRDFKSIHSDSKGLSSINSEKLDTTLSLNVNNESASVEISKDDIVKVKNQVLKDLDALFEHGEDFKKDKPVLKELIDNSDITLSNNKDSLEERLEAVVDDKDISKGYKSEERDLISKYSLKIKEEEARENVDLKKLFIDKDLTKLSENLYKKDDKKGNFHTEDIKIHENLNTAAIFDSGKVKNLEQQGLEMKASIERLNLSREIGETKDIHLISKGKDSLEVRVEPEGIGRIDIKLMLDNDSVNAKIVTFDSRSKEAIEGNILNIIDSLIKEGLNVSGFSVSLRQRKDESYCFKEDGDKVDPLHNKKDFIKKHTGEGIVSIFI